MRRILIGFMYDGNGFAGYQVQPKGETIQQVLEEAIAKVVSHKVAVVASGRTDAGVHAIEQVGHFDLLNDGISLDNLVRGTNSFLPSGIAVLWAKEVDKNFHAQKTAKKKTYRYICYQSDVELPLFVGRAAWIRGDVDVEAMKKAALCLVGEHDFSSFCASNSGRVDFVRTIYSIEIEKQNGIVPLIVFEVCGNGFLYKMVRNIVGLLLEVGQGRRKPEDVNGILRAKDRKLSGKTAPACGLYLKKVEY